MVIEKVELKLEELLNFCMVMQEQNAILFSLWGSDERVKQQAYVLHLLFWLPEKMLYCQIKLNQTLPVFPDLSQLFPVANRLQRALYDLLGIKAENATDTRSWLRHQAWSADQFPLRTDFKACECKKTDEIYPFIRVMGAGVHEIPVGPVHAGTIEPGHFRFSVLGERVLKLEEQLGYVHKGIAKSLQGLSINAAAKIIARISGDATVAYSLAFAKAVEPLTYNENNQSVAAMRAILLERERVANHLGDLGALGNDGGLAFGLAQFSRLKELWLRTQAEIFGHRYMMDKIIPGQTAISYLTEYHKRMILEIHALKKELKQLHKIYLEHAGLQNRFMGAGKISHELAKQLGLLGLVARASHIAIDYRVASASYPYNEFPIKLITQKLGGVAARVELRFQEIFNSLEWIEKLLNKFPEKTDYENKLENKVSLDWSIGITESWRGPVMIAVQLDEQHNIAHAHIHDCSWQNWPALEYAILNNIVADFPLINKSFNLTYSGHDV